MTQPVFRFAPSPNGYLHLGHAASALLNERLACETGGRLLLRIEDIDPQRSRPAFVAAIAEDLGWLGLAFDGAVLRQSEHLADYAGALRSLAERGLAFRCFCSRGDTARRVAEREAGGDTWPRDPDGAPHHGGPCTHLDPAEARARAEAGEPHAWRLHMDDAVRAIGGAPHVRQWTGGNAVEEVATAPAAWGDVLIARRDVPTSYHLSVVVDDARQAVTHVVRGEDLRASTAVHRVLQDLLGLPQPLYRHHRLLLDEAGRKLAKSRSSLPLRALRAQGWTPQDVRKAARLD